MTAGASRLGSGAEGVIGVDKAPDAFRTISEVADDLDLPQHVLRFWETRFAQIKPMKRGGGRRYYRPEDVDLLRGIRHLLYGEGYTIRGVQRILKDEGVKFVQSVWRSGAPQPARLPTEVERADERAAPAGSSSDNGLPEEETGRGRGFFGILPSLLGGEIERPGPADDRHAGRVEPMLAPLTEAVPLVREPESPAHETSGASLRQPPLAPESLSREELRALRATLYELGECKRLLDGALTED
jgi:DNA-binding transcriptional MerR regulator